jgi:cytochrome c oxidase cbb3-type subunit III
MVISNNTGRHVVWARMLLTATWMLLTVAARAQEGDSPLGKTPEPFGHSCAVCHGGDAQGTDRAPPLQNSRSLRGRSAADITAIITKGRGNMPSFAFLPAEQIQALASFIHTLNADAFDAKPPGDTAAGAALFFGGARCSQCHTALGRGGANGPDLSNIARQFTVSELARSLEQPDAGITAGYETVEVTLADGSLLRGFARSRGSHSLAL